MVNKFLSIVLLLPILVFIGVNSIKCRQKDGTVCEGQYCFYVNYTTFINGSRNSTDIFQGCTPDFMLTIPDNKDGAKWTFPINHCQHFQTNQTGQNYQYFYGNVCNTRDNCTYNDNGDLVCAGFRSTPFLALFLMIIFGSFAAKLFV